MSKRKKKIDFIRQNRNLPVTMLSLKTGWPENQVLEILNQFKEEPKGLSPASNLISAQQNNISNGNQVRPNRIPVDKRTLWFFALLTAFSTLIVYLPSLKNDFVNWDDADNIINNSHIRTLNFSSIHWMLTNNFENYWIPLSWFSWAVDYWLGGLNPFVFHLTNLILHTFNTVLVFFFSLRILKLARLSQSPGLDTTPKPTAAHGALMTALLFGLHPIHVESVAWATERKDILYTFFFLLGLLAYLDYQSSIDRKKWKLWGCVGLYLLALMSKPMAVTLPLVYLILDVWPLGRMKANVSSVIKEKIPFFALALIVGFTTLGMMAEKKGIVQSGSIAVKTMNAFHSLAFYIWKMIAPFHLLPFYPFPRHFDSGYYIVAVLGVLLTLLGFLICALYRKDQPNLGAAWLYFIVTILPTLGLIQVIDAMAADRYMYLPSLSLFLLFSGAVAVFAPNRKIFLGLCGLLLILLGFGTIRQIGVWKNSKTLWENVVKVYPDESSLAHSYLAISYEQKGLLDDSLSEYNRALSLSPESHLAHDGKGIVLFKKGLVDEAIQEYKLALTDDPDFTLAHQNLWGAYEKKGMHDAAISEIKEAIKIDPDSAVNYAKLGTSYSALNQWSASDEAFKTAFNLDPDSAESHNEKGNVFARMGKWDAAIEEFKTALALNPRYALPALNLWNIFEHQGRHKDAIDVMLTATQNNPDDAEVFIDLGVSFSFLKQLSDAEMAFKKAFDLDPANPQNLVNLATIYQWQGRVDESMALYQKGILGNPKEPVYYLKMADLYLDKHLPAEALEMLDTGIRLNPGDPKIVQQMGEDYERAGRKSLAQQCFAKARILSSAFSKSK